MLALTSMQSEHKEPVDEAGVIDAHKAAYQDNNASSLSSSSLGSAAAMQVRISACRLALWLMPGGRC